MKACLSFRSRKTLGCILLALAASSAAQAQTGESGLSSAGLITPASPWTHFSSAGSVTPASALGASAAGSVNPAAIFPATGFSSAGLVTPAPALGQSSSGLQSPSKVMITPSSAGLVGPSSAGLTGNSLAGALTFISKPVANRDANYVSSWANKRGDRFTNLSGVISSFDGNSITVTTPGGAVYRVLVAVTPDSGLQYLPGTLVLATLKIHPLEVGVIYDLVGLVRAGNAQAPEDYLRLTQFTGVVGLQASSAIATAGSPAVGLRASVSGFRRP